MLSPAMSMVNVMAKEIAAKVVFYGPGLSGKTTTLKRVYESVRPEQRGELMSLPTEADRTLFFDFLPVKVERVGEFSVRLALYTVPGQVFYNATRKLVLQGADGVVFVADSQEAMEDANRESLMNLEENLAEQGVQLDKFPLVIQYNKRDVPKAMHLDRLRSALKKRGVPEFPTCATSGQGVLDALKAVMKLVIRDLRQKRVVPAPKQREDPAKADKSLEGQLRQHLPAASPPAATSKTPSPAAPARRLGATASLAPAPLLDQAQAAEAAYASGDFAACTRNCHESVRRALSFAGEGSFITQATMLRVDGPDLLKLEALSKKTDVHAHDAAFALYVLMQTFARLWAAGLPAPSN
jgi:signal recognition particle receptor subunit beta